MLPEVCVIKPSDFWKKLEGIRTANSSLEY
jgi:hypothetical protein